MALRTVRLDDDAERTLAEVRKKTGLPISEALKQGLHTLADQVHREGTPHPYDVYRTLAVGSGGYGTAPARHARSAVKKAIARKLRRRRSPPTK